MGLKDAAAKPLLAGTDLGRTLRLRDLPVGTRLRMCAVALRAWFRIFPRDLTFTFPSEGSISLSAQALNSDWNVFSEVFLSRCYSTEYNGVAVIDVGAHKGYYGAFALINGAVVVRSFEPERTNYKHLQMAADSFRAHGHVWEIRKVAIGHQSSFVSLNVSGESWTHSLLPLPDQGPRSRVAVETVEMVPLEDVINQVAALDQRVVVKIDVEGVECAIVLGTSIEAWSCVDEVFVETHSFATCGAGRIIGHLKPSGLELLPDSTDQIAHLRRPH